MGLFGAKPEAQEAKADQLLPHDPLAAYKLYQEALRKLFSKDPLAVERLRGKIRDARQGFIRAKLAEAAAYIEDGISDAADESIVIAREHLKPDEPELAREIETMAARVRQAQEPVGAPGPSSRLTADSAPVFVAGVPEVDESLAPPGEPDDEGELTAFEMYAGILEPEDIERAEIIGEEFKAGFVAYQQGDRRAAIAAFEKAAASHPHEALVHELLGQVLDQANEEARAADHFAKALALDPHRVNARLALAQMLAGLGRRPGRDTPPDIARAIELLHEGQRIDPSQETHFSLAIVEILIAGGRGAEAVELLEPLLQGDYEREAPVWQLYAAGLEIKGSLDEAEEAYRRLVQLSGNAMGPRGLFAEFALRHNRALAEAERSIFETCIGCQANPPSAETLDRYGVLLSRIQFARGEYRAALDGVERLMNKGAPADLVPILQQLRVEARERLAAPGGTGPEA
jgi:tetratricopeptide (TPR) repeat protein